MGGQFAKLNAALLCADLKITLEIREDHTDYIGHWLKVLQDDMFATFQAATDALHAADYSRTCNPWLTA